MKDIVKNIIDNVFSFGFFMLMACAALFYVALISIDESSTKTQACYKAGLIKVSTDAGSYCVDPVNLVEIK